MAQLFEGSLSLVRWHVLIGEKSALICYVRIFIRITPTCVTRQPSKH
jgi:hypothetical protein